MNRRALFFVVPVLLAIVVALVVFLPSAKNGPEPIAHGKDACAQCRMVISQPGYAGELRDRSGEISKFDDVGCLLISLAGKRKETPEAWVEDFEGKTLVPLLGATLVRSEHPTPMGHGVVAFADPAKASAFAAAKKGKIVPLEELLGAFTKGGTALAQQSKPFTALEAELGKDIYTRECSACHGTLGAGDGPATAFLDPKPRDFTKKTFKFRTTDTGKPPRSEDILATLERGLPGSAMPSFAFLSLEDRRKVGAYVFKISGLLGKPEPPPYPDPGAPPEFSVALVERGKVLFKEQGCVACHGETGKGDGPSAGTMKDSVGRPVRPRDFTTGVFRGGAEPKDVYYRIFAGIDGTPMPAFGENATAIEDRWALVAFVKSLASVTPAPLPDDPILAGRAVASKYGCAGCHVLDDGKGGEVGPPFKLAGQKLRPEWIRGFLEDPRAPGKIYPWRIHRMPGLKLADPEIEAMVTYLGAAGRSKASEHPLPDVSAFPEQKLTAGNGMFGLRCAQCHALGSIVKTPLASQQGPDLINVAGRLDYAWMRPWILDPKKFDPKSKMTVTGITPDEAEAVAMFVWKASQEEQKKAAAATTTTTTSTIMRP